MEQIYNFFFKKDKPKKDKEVKSKVIKDKAKDKVKDKVNNKSKDKIKDKINNKVKDKVNNKSKDKVNNKSKDKVNNKSKDKVKKTKLKQINGGFNYNYYADFKYIKKYIISAKKYVETYCNKKNNQNKINYNGKRGIIYRIMNLKIEGKNSNLNCFYEIYVGNGTTSRDIKNFLESNIKSKTLINEKYVNFNSNYPKNKKLVSKRYGLDKKTYIIKIERLIKEKNYKYLQIFMDTYGELFPDISIKNNKVIIKN